MTTPRTRPELQAPDLSPPPTIGSGLKPRATDPDDPRFAGAQQFETHDNFVEGVRKGRVRVSNLDTIPERPADLQLAPTAVRRRSPEVSLSTKVPETVLQQLLRRYADNGVTIRNQILLALRKDGLEVADDDLQDERKRPRR
jgi:hypothetical protein